MFTVALTIALENIYIHALQMGPSDTPRNYLKYLRLIPVSYQFAVAPPDIDRGLKPRALVRVLQSLT